MRGKLQVILSLITWAFLIYSEIFSTKIIGFVCMDCSILARCVFRNNGWDTVPLEVCDAGQNQFCNANEQRCSANPG